MFRLVVLLLITLVTACAYQTGPKENSQFVSLQNLAELNGLFSNIGEPNGYLSGILWGREPHSNSLNLDHAKIEFIQVEATENSLLIKAIQNNCVVHSEAFSPQNDVSLIDGKINLPANFSLFSEVHVGPNHQSQTLGLDSNGDGKYKSQEYVVGLAFLVLPFALSEKREITFKKMPTSGAYDEC